MNDPLAIQIEKLDVKPGDVLVVHSDKIPCLQSEIVLFLGAIAHAKRCQFVVLSGSDRIEALDEHAMNAAGWHRRQESCPLVVDPATS